jgi:hypothetical protein
MFFRKTKTHFSFHRLYHYIIYIIKLCRTTPHQTHSSSFQTQLHTPEINLLNRTPQKKKKIAI